MMCIFIFLSLVLLILYCLIMYECLYIGIYNFQLFIYRFSTSLFILFINILN